MKRPMFCSANGIFRAEFSLCEIGILRHSPFCGAIPK